MKTVFSNSRIAHLWFHQTQKEARNAGGSHSFIGAHIRSYAATIAAIAAIARTGKGAAYRTAVFMTTRRYSVTTSKHMSYVLRAIPSDTPIFNVLEPSDCVRSDGTIRADNCIKTYSERIASAIERLASGRMNTEAKRLIELQHIVDEANECMAFIGRKRRFAMPTGYDIEAAREVVARKAKREEVARKKRIAEQETRARFQRESDWPEVERWRNGESDRYPHSWVDVISLRIMPGVPKDDLELQVETSRGAEFPLSHCRRILDLVRSGTPYQSNGHSIHAGVFRVDSIDAAGNVRAGCHVVSREEIERFACTLGWE